VNSESQSVVTEGSALYYALLHAKQPFKTRAIETLQFIQTLSTTLNDVTEGDVAEKKIHWWHEELTRLANQQARHPASIAVQSYLHSETSIKASLAILSANATERYAAFATEQALNEAIKADYGARLSLFETALKDAPATKTDSNDQHRAIPVHFQAKSDLLDNTATKASQKTELIAMGLGQFDRLNSLAKRLRFGYSVFSDERYTAFELTPETLLNRSSTAPDASQGTQQKIDALLAHAVTESFAALESAVNAISKLPQLEPTSLSVQILCQVRCAQLKLWKKRKPDLLSETITLTPLRKFFIAYRCKRRFKHP